MHLKPAEGMPRPVGRAIVDHLFPEDETGRIDIVGLAGSKGTRTIARLVAWLLHLSGRRVGLACRDGLFLGGRQIDRTDGACWEAGHRLLLNRSVDAVVIENGPTSVLNDGLAYDRCHVGVVTDLWFDAGAAQALAAHDVRESAQLAKVLRTQIDVVMPDGVAVLNASDARIAEMAALCDGDVILYAVDENTEALAAHRAAGGRCALVRDGWAVLAMGAAETRCANLAHASRRFETDEALPAPHDRVEVLLAAIATAWALGISPELMAAGIDTFAVTVTAGVVAPPGMDMLSPAATVAPQSAEATKVAAAGVTTAALSG
jgi:cyanophycin synthetase